MNPLRSLADFFIRRRPNFLKDSRKTFLVTRQFLNQNRWKCLGSFLLVLLSAFFVKNFDRSLLDQVRGEKLNPDLNLLAREVSHWGDFLQLNLGGFLLIWGVGYLLRDRWLQRLAHSVFLAAILAGITCNAFRLTTGRPRPKAMVEDGFYGIPGTVKGWNYHSFPSGHTSTAFGSVSSLACSGGIWGAPLLSVGAMVGWSRLYANQHYPTDLLVGGFIGILFGFATSWRLRKVRLRVKRRKKRLRAASVSRAVSGWEMNRPRRRKRMIRLLVLERLPFL